MTWAGDGESKCVPYSAPSWTQPESIPERLCSQLNRLGCLLDLKGLKVGKAMAHFPFTQSAGGKTYCVFSEALGRDRTPSSHLSPRRCDVFTCSGPRLGTTVWASVPWVYTTGKMSFDCGVPCLFQIERNITKWTGCLTRAVNAGKGLRCLQ